MKQLIEHRLEVAEHNLDEVNIQDHPHPDTIRTLEVRIQELRDILKELERVEIKPEPQPIEKLFELKEDTDVWVKSNDGTVYCTTYEVDERMIYVDGLIYTEDSFLYAITHHFTDFLIAEVPKF